KRAPCFAAAQDGQSWHRRLLLNVYEFNVESTKRLRINGLPHLRFILLHFEPRFDGFAHVRDRLVARCTLRPASLQCRYARDETSILAGLKNDLQCHSCRSIAITSCSNYAPGRCSPWDPGNAWRNSRRCRLRRSRWRSV